MTGQTSNASRRESGSAGGVLGLIFVCLAAGIVTVGYLYYRNHERHDRSEVERQLSAIADLKVGELIQWRKERLADGAVFFKNGSFSGCVRRFLDKPEDAEARRAIQAWIEKLQTAGQYNHVRLLDVRGVTRLSFPEGRPEMSSTVAQRLPEVLQTNQVTFQDFYRNEHDQRVYLAILVPIFDDQEGGRPLGTLVLRIDPELYLYPFIQRWPTPSRTAETLIVRREGNEVVFLNELRFHPNSALTLRLPLERKDVPAVAAALGQEGFMQGIDYWEGPVVAALRTIPNSPWFLVARMDIAEVYLPLRERLWQIVALIGVLLFGAGAGTALIWRQQSARYYQTKYEAGEARAKLAAIVESAEDAIISKSLNGTITSWNAGAERLFGYPSAEMIGQNIARIIPPTEWPAEKELLKRLRHGERINHYETVRLAKDGRSIAVSLIISPILDAAGTIIGAAKIVRDITERKRSAEALRASEEQFRAMFERASVGIAQSDPSTGHWMRVNEKMCTITGYSAEELIRMRISEITHPDDRQSDWEAYQRVVRGEQPDYRLEKRYLRKDRSVAWVNVNMTIIRDATGRPVQTVATIEDITERKRAEAALVVSQARYRRLFEAARDGILILDAESGMIVEVNPSLVEMLGYTHEQFLGKRIWEVRLFKDIVANQDHFAELQRKEYLTYEDKPLETADGRRIEVEFVSHAYEVEHHKVIQCNIRDITERKRAEQALRESEERFVQFMLNLPAMTFIKDCERRIVFVNARVRQVLGLTAVNSLGRLSEDIWPGPLGQMIREEDERVLGNGEVRAVVQEIPTGDGVRVFRAIKFLIPRGQQPPLLGDISIDITELRQAEEKILRLNAELEQRVRDRTAELEAANRELEAFSYSVSHDLRAPLRAMDGFSMALIEDYAGKLDATALDYLRRIRSGSERMAGLIDDMLNLSQVTRTEMRLESVNLTDMAEGIGAELRQLQPDRQVEFVVAPALAAEGDAHLLRQALYNLLNNAWKFTGRCAQARIEVGALEQDNGRVFFVRDNGAGFDMAYVGKLFGAFQRLHSTQEFEGTGIGLAIVQRIIHRHGGSVWAEGAVGAGATVYFTLKAETVRLEDIRLEADRPKAEGVYHA
jgi:PAS domain S-box-containing protein